MTKFSLSHRISQEELSVLERYTSSIPVKVGALAESLGLRVVLATLPMNISGMIQPDGEKFVIKINRFESKERQRFTIAHEISHYLLHRDRISTGIVDSVLYRSKLSSRIEAEANRLGAEIIMPADAIASAMLHINGDPDDETVADLAQQFGVSRQAMAIRLS